MAEDLVGSINSESDFRRVSISRPWNTVWQRRKQSKRKLRQFFGKSAPVDVSPSDVENLLEQYSSENLFFYLEVEQFQTHEFKGRNELRRTGLQLYRAFIKSNSDFEVNIDHSTRKPIRLAIDQYDPHCFDEAKEQIQRLMEPCFLNFISSKIYKKMLEDLKDKSIPYDDHVREGAINVLVQYLDKNMPVSSKPKDDTGPVGEVERRNNLIRAMIHAFCQTRLHLDFYDTPNGENIKLTPENMLPPQDDTSTGRIEVSDPVQSLMKRRLN